MKLLILGATGPTGRHLVDLAVRARRPGHHPGPQPRGAGRPGGSGHGGHRDACGLPEPSPAWWVTFRVVDEGSWGSRGGVLSVLSLLDSGVFTEQKAEAVRAALGV